MLSRALSLATVTLLIGCCSATAVQAENLDAGKSPLQLFAGTCNACHKSPRGLMKTVSAGSLPGFLREHYTTSIDMARQLSAFLISNGAADTRPQPKQAKDAKLEGKPVQPQADGLSPQGESPNQGRNAKRLARPGEPPEGVKPAVEGQAPVQAAIERGPDGRKLSAKERLTKRGKGGIEEPPKTDMDNPDVVKEEPSKGEPPKDVSNLENGKEEGVKPEAAKPTGEDKSGPAKVDASREPSSGETSALRPDPVPAVTPAPPASATAPATSQAPAAAVSSATPEPVPAAPTMPAQPPTQAQAAPPPPPATETASVPPPVTPAGPPAPPISQ
jgi:hypothetical protein